MPISWYNFFNKENVSEANVAISEKADRVQNYKRLLCIQMQTEKMLTSKIFGYILTKLSRNSFCNHISSHSLTHVLPIAISAGLILK